MSSSRAFLHAARHAALTARSARVTRFMQLLTCDRGLLRRQRQLATRSARLAPKLAGGLMDNRFGGVMDNSIVHDRAGSGTLPFGQTGPPTALQTLAQIYTGCFDQLCTQHTAAPNGQPQHTRAWDDSIHRGPIPGVCRAARK